MIASDHPFRFRLPGFSLAYLSRPPPRESELRSDAPTRPEEDGADFVANAVELLDGSERGAAGDATDEEGAATVVLAGDALGDVVRVGLTLGLVDDGRETEGVELEPVGTERETEGVELGLVGVLERAIDGVEALGRAESVVRVVVPGT
jgi:hypothetical protein